MKRRMPRSYGRRKKRRMSRRFGRRKYSRRVTKSFLNVKRTFVSGQWNFNTTATSDFWKYYTFTLGDLPSVSEFTPVFDEYRVRAIKVTFRPNVDGTYAQQADAATATTTQSTVAWLHTCVDPMSTVVPTGTYTNATINSFLENDRVRSRRLKGAVSVYFRPILTDAVTGSGTAAARVSPRQWIRTSDTAATYRGFHALMQAENPSVIFKPSVTVFITFYMQFKNLR